MSNGTQPGKPGGFGRISKALAFWLLVFLVPVAFLQFSRTGSDAATKLSYSDFITQLRTDNVAKVTVVAGKEVRGEFVRKYAPPGGK